MQSKKSGITQLYISYNSELPDIYLNFNYWIIYLTKTSENNMVLGYFLLNSYACTKLAWILYFKKKLGPYNNKMLK